MPAGIELMFGIRHPHIVPAVTTLGTGLTTFYDEGSGQQLQDALHSVQLTAFQSLGIVPTAKQTTPDYTRATVPTGEVREFSRLDLILYAEPEFDEHPNDDTVVLGVSVTSRYFPVLLDWREESGGIYPLTLTPSLLSEMEMVRQLLLPVLPAEFTTHGAWTVKEMWY